MLTGIEVTRNAQARIVIGKAWNDCTPEEQDKVRAYKRALQDKKRKPVKVKAPRKRKLSTRRFIAPSHGRPDSLHACCCR